MPFGFFSFCHRPVYKRSMALNSLEIPDDSHKIFIEAALGAQSHIYRLGSAIGKKMLPPGNKWNWQLGKTSWVFPTRRVSYLYVYLADAYDILGFLVRATCLGIVHMAWVCEPSGIYGRAPVLRGIWSGFYVFHSGLRCNRCFAEASHYYVKSIWEMGENIENMLHPYIHCTRLLHKRPCCIAF